MSEQPIVAAILKAFATLGVWAWRTNAGTAHGGKIRLAPAGTPDILGVLRGGRLFGIECKDPKTGRARAAQEVWRVRAEHWGVLYGKVTSLSEALALYRQWTGQEEIPWSYRLDTET